MTLWVNSPYRLDVKADDVIKMCPVAFLYD